MTPWPAKLAELYPVRRRNKDRPWWVFTVDGRWVRERDHWLLPDTSELPRGEAMARIDAEHPLPHPGFRVGQIWANGTSGCAVQVIATYPSGNVEAGNTAMSREVMTERFPFTPPK